jgi:hypothetical protein
MALDVLLESGVHCGESGAERIKVQLGDHLSREYSAISRPQHPKRRHAMATGVYRFSGGPIPPGGSQVHWFWVGYPNNNPDLSLTWELRPIRQRGHESHPQHKVRLDLIELERTDVDPNGNGVPRGWLTWFRLVSTGTHPTDWELLANWQTI